jgi:predicted SAM-dependent methyltransferase
MENPLVVVARRIFSPGERAALRTYWNERIISSYHRKGLRRIQSESLQAPPRLNLGCGPFKKSGFLNVDLMPPADVTLDLRRDLPFHANCCELIFSEHCFEHFDYPEPVSHLFRECHRILKPGGILSFSVPDTEWPLTDYRDGPNAAYFLACQEHKWHPQECTTRLEHINYHFRQGTEHRYAYDIESAAKVLNAAGFTDVRSRTYDSAIDSTHRRVGSLFVVAKKPGQEP